MPYKLRGSCVVRADTGASVKCHPDREKALAHLRALKANVSEGVLGSLLEGFDEATHPRGWHGRWVGTNRGKVLRVFHGGAHVGDVNPGESSKSGVARVASEAGRSISPAEVAHVVDHAAGSSEPSPRKLAPGANANEPRAAGSVSHAELAQRLTNLPVGRTLNHGTVSVTHSRDGFHVAAHGAPATVHRTPSGAAGHARRLAKKEEPARPTTRERRMARADRLEGWAAKREQRAAADYQRGRAQVDQIPLGEPIHSRQDANRRRKAFAPMERSFASSAKAESMRSRAENIRSQADRAIYSDDPGAADALKVKITQLEAQRDRIKAYNASARKAAKSGGVGDVSLLDDGLRAELVSLRKIGRFGMGPGDALPKYMLTNLGGNINRAKKRLAQLAPAQEAVVLGTLLERFDEQHHPRGWHGRFRPGDRVRVSLKRGGSIVGKVVRPADAYPESHVVIQPDNHGPHVLAHVKSVKLDTPERHNLEHERRVAREVKATAGPGAWRSRGAKRAPDMNVALSRMMARKPVMASEALGICLLVEAFAPSQPSPNETPQQSLTIAKQQVAGAQKELAGWDASKHPRGGHGRFGSKGGRAARPKKGRRGKGTKSMKGKPIGDGATGSQVATIQKLLGIPVTAAFNDQTESAVSKFQQQHGIQVTGAVDAQTMALLRVAAQQAKAAQRQATRQQKAQARAQARAKAPKATARAKAPVRLGGGVVA